MNIFQTNINGKDFGYKVGQNGCTAIKKAGKIVTVTIDYEETKLEAKFDLTGIPFYLVG